MIRIVTIIKPARIMQKSKEFNYIKIYTKSSQDLTNALLPAKLVETYKDGVWGDIISE